MSSCTTLYEWKETSKFFFSDPTDPAENKILKNFAKTVNGRKTLTTISKNPILDVSQGSEYASMYQTLKFAKHK